MRVLVTGATGFVGRHVVTALLARGHDVTAVARDAQKAAAMPWFGNACVRFVSCDLHGSEVSPRELLGDADAVIHLAWPGLPNYRELFHFEETLPADYKFLKSLVISGYQQLLVVGTCLEYGMQSECLDEDMAVKPTTPYGIAKDSLRKFLQSLQGKHPFRLQWARLFYMYGEGQNPNSLLAQLERAANNGDAAFNMSAGEQLRDYLSVIEVAQRLVTLVEHPGHDGVINICSGNPVSVRQMVERYLSSRGVTMKLNLGHYPYLDYESMAFWGSTKKFLELNNGDKGQQ